MNSKFFVPLFSLLWEPPKLSTKSCAGNLRYISLETIVYFPHTVDLKFVISVI